MSLPSEVRVVEVGPRDGLQNEANSASVAQRLSLIHDLAAAGLTSIEAGSFISPKWVPQMANTAEVFAALDLNQGIRYPALVPNLRGFEDALDAGVKEIAVFSAASETFSQKNTNCSIAEGIARYEQVIEQAHSHHIAVRGYVSCVMGCPYEGEIALSAVVDVAHRLSGLGCYEISLGDTIGVGTPIQTQTMINAVANVIGMERIAVHFHDTYGQALANIYAALNEGIKVIDSSVAGLGGCPYASGASGNVATEEVVYMLDHMGITTGIDLELVIGAGRRICAQLDTPVRSKVNLAWNSNSTKPL